jgi:streptogramin lyase
MEQGGAFTGTLNGNGNSISNIYQNSEQVPFTGIFFATEGADIVDVTINSISITGVGTSVDGSEAVVAGLISMMSGGSVEGIKLKNLEINGVADGIVGGLVGQAQFAQISNSSVEGDIILSKSDQGVSYDYLRDVAFDSVGNMYLAMEGVITKLDPDGNLISTWGAYGEGDGEFGAVSGIAIDQNDIIYITDPYNYRIQKFDSSGNYLSQFGSQGSGDGDFQSSPNGIDVDEFGNIYVSTWYGTKKFSNDGTFINNFNGASGHNDVAVDAVGNVFVAASGSGKILKFDGSGNLIAEWGSSGSGDGQFGNFVGIDVDSLGNIYTLENSTYRVQKFGPDGTFITKWGSEGSEPGMFKYPEGLSVDNDGDIFVADTDNKRLQKFDSSGNYITSFGSPSNLSEMVGVGGIVAFSGLSNISKSYADTNISVHPHPSHNGVIIGGLTAASTGEIDNSYSKGSISVDGGVVDGGLEFESMIGVGGISGQQIGSVTNSYATTDIDTTNYILDREAIGGAFGFLFANEDQTVNINNTFAKGHVQTSGTGMFPNGGLVGLALSEDDTSIININGGFYDKTISNQEQCVGAFLDRNMNIVEPESQQCTAVNTDGNSGNYFINNMQNPPLDQWNFDDVWRVQTTDAPTLRGTEPPVPTAPGVPRNLSVSSTSPTSVNLQWQQPASSGHSLITDYIVQYKENNSNTWQAFNDGISTTTSTTINSLVTGNTYNFRVAAVNAIGAGAFTNQANFELGSVPGVPQNFKVDLSLANAGPFIGPEAVEGAGFALPKATWDAPTSGQPIIGYEVEYRKVGSSDWIPLIRDDVLSEEALLSLGLEEILNIDTDGLTQEELDELAAQVIQLVQSVFNSEEFEMRVAAVNSNGTGEFTEPQSVRTGLGATTCEGLQNVLFWGTFPEITEEFEGQVFTLQTPYISLLNNIDCSETINWNDDEGWMPVGNLEYSGDIGYPFRGVFDGHGHTIQNLHIKRTENSGFSNSEYETTVGMFGAVKGGTVMNVKLEGGTIEGGSGAGALVGVMSQNSLVNGVESNATVISEGFAGGIVGVIDNTGNIAVRNSKATGKVKSMMSGGVIGFTLTGDAGLGEFSADSFAFDSGGNMYVAGNGVIQKYGTDRRFLKAWGNNDAEPGFVNDWQDIAYFSSPGKFSNYSIMQVEVDSLGNVYVSDTGNSRLQKFNSEGELLQVFGGDGEDTWPNVGSGSADGQFASNYMRFVVDYSNNVYVLDDGNERIQKFNSSGNFVSKWGSTGHLNGQLSDSRQIAVDKNNNIYVYGYAQDSAFRRIQKFSSNGAYIATFGTTGPTEEQLPYYYGESPNNQNMAIDDNGNVYVINGTKAKVFGSNGAFVRSFNIQPSAVSVSVTGGAQPDVYVASSTAGTGNYTEDGEPFNYSPLMKFSSEGAVLKLANSSQVSSMSQIKFIDNGGQYIYGIQGSNKSVVKKFDSGLTFIGRVDGTENDNGGRPLQLTGNSYIHTFAQDEVIGEDQLFGGGIIGFSGSVNMMTDEGSFTEFLSLPSNKPDVVVRDSVVNLQSFPNCFGSGGVVGTVVGSFVKVERVRIYY